MANNAATIHTPQSVVTILRHVGGEETRRIDSLSLCIAGCYTKLQSTLRVRLIFGGKMEGIYTYEYILRLAMCKVFYLHELRRKVALNK